jgi:HNH endonuclease
VSRPRNTIETLQKDFWQRVDVRGPDDCWTWRKGKNGSGYGVLYIHRKSINAQRIAYQLHYGVDPGDREVCHTCDNPPCCNPYHLFLGTHADNMRDREAKGRANHALGERNHNAKLTWQQVREIRSLCASGMQTRDVSIPYDVSTVLVNKIARGEIWKEDGMQIRPVRRQRAS